jgi:hypothetical protein
MAVALLPVVLVTGDVALLGPVEQLPLLRTYHTDQEVDATQLLGTNIVRTSPVRGQHAGDSTLDRQQRRRLHRAQARPPVLVQVLAASERRRRLDIRYDHPASRRKLHSLLPASTPAAQTGGQRLSGRIQKQAAEGSNKQL